MVVVDGRQKLVAGRQVSLLSRQFSIWDGVLPINQMRISSDIIAGWTLDALASMSSSGC